MRMKVYEPVRVWVGVHEFGGITTREKGREGEGMGHTCRPIEQATAQKSVAKSMDGPGDHARRAVRTAIGGRSEVDGLTDEDKPAFPAFPQNLAILLAALYSFPPTSSGRAMPCHAMPSSSSTRHPGPTITLGGPSPSPERSLAN